jgi:putative membrane protein
VQDHQQALDQLKKLADQKNVQVSDQLDSRHQRMADELSSLSGADFDKRFMNQQIRAHKRAISLYQQAAQSNTDAEVKQWAQQNVAGLQHHLQMAQQQGGISEPAGAPSSSDQGSSSQPQQGQSSSSSPDQSGQSAQPGQSSPSSQPDQSQPSPK